MTSYMYDIRVGSSIPVLILTPWPTSYRKARYILFLLISLHKSNQLLGDLGFCTNKLRTHPAIAFSRAGVRQRALSKKPNPLPDEWYVKLPKLPRYSQNPVCSRNIVSHHASHALLNVRHTHTLLPKKPPSYFRKGEDARSQRGVNKRLDEEHAGDEEKNSTQQCVYIAWRTWALAVRMHHSRTELARHRFVWTRLDGRFAFIFSFSSTGRGLTDVPQEPRLYSFKRMPHFVFLRVIFFLRRLFLTNTCWWLSLWSYWNFFDITCTWQRHHRLALRNI